MNRRMLLIVLAGCSLSGAASADIVNGGFESDLTGWDAHDGRNVEITDGIGGLVYEGQHAARLHYTFGADGVELNQQLAGLTPGQFYEVTGMVNVTEFVSRGWAVAGLQININASQAGGLLYSAVVSEVTDGWRPFAVQFMAPTDGEAWINTAWYGANSGDAYIDGMSIRTTPTPATATLLAAGLLARGRRRA